MVACQAWRLGSESFSHTLQGKCHEEVKKPKRGKLSQRNIKRVLDLVDSHEDEDPEDGKLQSAHS